MKKSAPYRRTHQQSLSQQRLLYDLCELYGDENIFNER